jgi:hypothetical protein
MKTIRTVGAMSLAAGLLAAIGCARHPSQTAAAVPGTQPPPGVMSQQNEAQMRVVDQLTNARCDHEQTCKNIGPGQKFVSRETCVDQVRGTMANDINAYNCPRGIDQQALDHCLSSLRSEECSFSFNRLFSENACGATSLCIK